MGEVRYHLYPDEVISQIGHAQLDDHQQNGLSLGSRLGRIVRMNIDWGTA
jgi:hypothetical protein